MIGHIVKTHKDILAVENNRISFSVCAKQGNMFSLNVKNETGTCLVKTCFGCNKFWAKSALADEHKKECPNKLEHKKVCESLLPVNNMVERIEQLSNDSSALLLKLQEQIKQLEKKNTRLEKENKMLQEGSFKWDKIFNVIGDSYDEDFKIELVDKLNSNKEDDDDFDIDWNAEFDV